MAKTEQYIIFEEGRKAFIDGLTWYDHNPYRGGSEEALTWDRGYDYQKRHGQPRSPKPKGYTVAYTLNHGDNNLEDRYEIFIPAAFGDDALEAAQDFYRSLLGKAGVLNAVIAENINALDTDWL